jgi:hypothetical protein
VLDSLADLAAQLVAHGLAKLSHGEVCLYGTFDLLEAKERQVADPFLTAGAEEVEVVTAIAFAQSDDHAVATAMTPQSALEPVLVPSLPSTFPSVLGEHALDALVRLFGNESLVSAAVLDAFVGHLAHVVAVGEHVVEVAE